MVVRSFSVKDFQPTESVSKFLKCPKSTMKVYTAGLIVKREYLDKIRYWTATEDDVSIPCSTDIMGARTISSGCLWACGCKIGETIALSGDTEDNDDKQMLSIINVERMKQLKFMMFGNLDMSVSE